jgi:hypothetical protein
LHAIPTYAPSLVTPNPQAAVCEASGNACANDDYCTANVCEAKRIACVEDDDCDVFVCEDSKDSCTDNTDCVPGYCRNDPSISCYVTADCASVGSTCRSAELCLTAQDDICGENNEECHASPVPLPGGCNYCHDAGIDAASGLDILDNHDTHHGKANSCNVCHLTDTHANDMRKCEECHGYESLHNIQADSPAAGNIGTILVGQEDAGYGHIGEDTPGADSDCWGCHGFSVAADGVEFGSGVPTIYSVDPIIIAAGTDTAIAITGAAFSNGALAVRLTDAAGNAVTLGAADVTDGSLTATANVAAGTYALQAVKDGEASNAVGISVMPQVAITDMDCSKCLGVMTIDGVNFAVKPDGTDEDISVTEDGRPLNVISWSDTEIKVSGARCRGDVVVNGVYGSSE